MFSRETIEEILSVVSPGCQNEVATAMEQQTDISDECKKEVQAVLMSMHGQPDAPAAEEVATKPRDGIHPGVWIAVFVAVLFGSVGAYVNYANKIIKEAYPEKPQKKLSKKKVLLSIWFFIISDLWM